ncbi:MAG: DUF1926 domain-containing protein [Candidatus Hydrogenedentes bacterium]|nr:DUF1926 domain-containing protein [Candidatus Hydrogenedentota bacterium]
MNTSKKMNLIFALHSHQPVGNFNFVFEEAYQKAYLPFLQVLMDFPQIKIALHISGPIWDWLDENHPEFYDLIKKLLHKKQIELMGGGYYEPLLCTLSEDDAIGQIEYMKNFIKDRFGVEPKGVWITERVWEPYYPKILSLAGVEYTAVDDTHFLTAGVNKNDLFGYYITEHEGYVIKIFPILEKLRYTIPFHPVRETIDYLKGIYLNVGKNCAVFHDDGEKFGIWPGTHNSVYKEKWLFNFFSAIIQESSWLTVSTYSEYMSNNPPLGRVYLPCASYHEMMEWVLPTDMQKEYMRLKKEFQQSPEIWEKVSNFFRGGFWRGFLTKYPESNNMQKRMIKLSKRFKQVSQKKPNHPLIKEAQKTLYQSQCNCGYWHGVFGGLYLNHIRTAVYQKIIETENILDKIDEIPQNWISTQVTDFNCDGNQEIIFETKNASFFFSPSNGGTLLELDFKPKTFNLLNVISRKKEAYHDDLLRQDLSHQLEEEGHKSIHELVKAKEKNLHEYLFYDSYLRYSMRDHFFPMNINIEHLYKNTYDEWWQNCDKNYDYKTDIDHILFESVGEVSVPPYSWTVKITKRFHLESCPDENVLHFSVQYGIENLSEGTFQGYFGCEWCFNFLTGSSEDRYIYFHNRNVQKKVGDLVDLYGTNKLSLIDEWQKIKVNFNFSEDARVFNFPLETVSQSENGQERIYQGNVVIICWQKEFDPKSVKTLNIKVSVETI